MALTDENGGGLNVSMPVQPMYGAGYPMMGGYGNGMFGGDWSSWIILFLIFGMFGGGWGMGGFGGFGGGLGFDFPWLLNGQNQINANTNSGFDHAATQSALAGLQNTVTAGFGDVQLGIAGINQSICQTGNGITAAVTGAQNALTQQMYTNEIASLNRSFAEQTANAQGFNNVQGQLAQCCCDQKYNTAQLQNVVQSEAAASRAATAAGNQAILDKLCQLELDGVRSQLDAERRENLVLQNQLNMAAFKADNVAQTAQLVADNTAQTQYIVNRVAPYPIPSYSVPNPFGCNGYNGNYVFAN